MSAWNEVNELLLLALHELFDRHVRSYRNLEINTSIVYFAAFSHNRMECVGEIVVIKTVNNLRCPSPCVYIYPWPKDLVGNTCQDLSIEAPNKLTMYFLLR